MKASFCLNCFGRNHTAYECNKTGCRSCNKKHNTMFPYDIKKPTAVSTDAQRKKPNFPSKAENEGNNASLRSMSTSVASSSLRGKFVLLPTVVVSFECEAKRGYIRILLDTGSQMSVIVDSFVQRHKLRTHQSNVCLSGIDGDIQSSAFCDVVLSSRHQNFYVLVSAEIIPASSLTYKIPSAVLEKLKCIKFNAAEIKLDYGFINMIIGADVYYEIVENRKLKITGGIKFQDTKFGLVHVGPAEINQFMNFSYPGECKQVKSSELSCHHITIGNIDRQLRKFWEIEESRRVNESSETDICEKYFEKTFGRLSDGKFIVCLLFKETFEGLLFDKSSRMKAIRSLVQDEQKYGVELRDAYVSFMREYRNLNYMSRVSSEFEDVKPVYYIPHHL